MPSMRGGGLAVLCLAGLLAGGSCSTCICSPYPFYSPVFLTTADANEVVPIGFYQAVGVLLPGSGRTINASDAGRVISYRPTVDQPDGMTYESFTPGTLNYTGKPPPFGGLVDLRAPAQGRLPSWHVLLMIGSDPFGENIQGTYSGRGTTLMVTGQSFIVTWRVGGAAPTTTNASVLSPVGPVLTLHSAYGKGPNYAFSVDKTFTQQLFIATGIGTATLNAPDAMPEGCNAAPSASCHSLLVGPGQEFDVRDDPGWSCSLGKGCSPLGTGEAPRPDGYHFTSPSPCAGPSFPGC
jgi:hypothetical protein